MLGFHCSYGSLYRADMFADMLSDFHSNSRTVAVCRARSCVVEMCVMQAVHHKAQLKILWLLFCADMSMSGDLKSGRSRATNKRASSTIYG